MLFGKSIEYALKGGAVDFTGNEDIDYWETICDEVRVCNGIKRMLDAGVNPDRMTISSDGQGSLPMYSSDGEFLGMGVGQSSCLLKEVKECVFKTETIYRMEVKEAVMLDNLLDRFVGAAIKYDDPTQKLNSIEERLISFISNNYKKAYRYHAEEKSEVYRLYLRLLLVTDYICGMTDSYAKRLYQELNAIMA